MSKSLPTGRQANDKLMSIFIQNSLTNKKEEFVPLESGEVKMYTCGVTVYDDCHIGHARSLYIFDCIRKYFKYRGFNVKFARNITDIDDKIINRARELNIDCKELVRRYIDRYYEDLRALGIEKGDYEPRATENVPEMIFYIEELVKKGFAYSTSTGVYFSVRKFKDYGKLSGQKLEEMVSGSRKETDETKEDPLDFALWKRSKEGEPFWESPWGNGRPGWHIECSVMSQKFLKTHTLDIHAGGRDLIFPHHENEIAQSQARTEKPFAKYWMHHGLLTINSYKMAKSLGNFITIKDFIAKYHNPDFLKFFFLSAHYSQPIDYTERKIEDAKKEYERIDIFLRRLGRACGARKIDDVISGGAGNIAAYRLKFEEYMDDDFNMPRALSVLFDMVTACNKLLDSNDEFKNFKLNYAMDLAKDIFNIFGLNFLNQVSGEMSDSDIELNISARVALKKAKKFKEADEIRHNLEEKGIILEDTKDGITWRRKI